ncbi:MAG: hypothetical protein GY868_14820 [Deltaproteobacteria bacterium]|nr:hypothetical protein [Deltaproteobacteria bacterium]
MKIICFVSQEKNFLMLKQQVFSCITPEPDIERHATIENFTARLKKGKNSYRVIIIYARNNTELKAVCSLNKLLLDYRVVMVIPDRKHETLALTCKLYPRCFISLDQDIKILADIINKIHTKFYIPPGLEQKETETNH